MQIRIYRFVGLSPLLMSNIESVNRDLPKLKLGTKPNAGDIEKIAEGMTYRDDDGNLCLPTQALRSSLIAGCKGQKMPGSRQSPAAWFQATIFPAELRATLIDDGGRPITQYEIQIDSGVNRKDKSRIIVVRPRIDKWSMLVPFEVDDAFAPPNLEEYLEIVLRIWNRAGGMCGIGAWRPEKQGRFGKYQVAQA